MENILHRNTDPYVNWGSDNEAHRNQLTVVFETDELCNQGYAEWQRNNLQAGVMEQHLENDAYLAMPWLTLPSEKPKWSESVRNHALVELGTGTQRRVATIGTCGPSAPEKDPETELHGGSMKRIQLSEVDAWLLNIAEQAPRGTQALLLVCKSQSNPGLPGNQVLSSVLNTAKSMDWDYLALYGGGCDDAASVVRVLDSVARRQVQETKNTTCDSKCKVQVSFLEGLLVGILLLVILLSGLSCLNYLETPSKFWTEQP